MYEDVVGDVDMDIVLGIFENLNTKNLLKLMNRVLKLSYDNFGWYVLEVDYYEIKMDELQPETEYYELFSWCRDNGKSLREILKKEIKKIQLTSLGSFVACKKISDKVFEQKKISEDLEKKVISFLC